MRNTAVHQSDSIRWQNPKNCSDGDTRCLCPGEGEDQDRRCEDVGLTGFPSKVLRWKGGKEGSWQGLRMQSGERCKS